MTRFEFAHRPVRWLLSQGSLSAFYSLMNGAGLGLRYPTLGAKTSARRGWGTLPLGGTRLLSRAALAVLCLWMILALPVRSQQGVPTSHPTFQQPLGQPVGGDRDDIPQGSPVQDERVLRALNADRQRSMVSDANKLLRLAKELNAEIARTNPDSLSLDQLHKMAEIEKLARNVKEKMSTSVRATPSYVPTMQPLQ
jgi:hypothetical protein